MSNVYKKRIDELGRIVIPKQIRNNFKIKNFDELELFVDNDSIIVKKCNSILSVKDELDNYLYFIKKYLSVNSLIISENVVVSSNISIINYNDELKSDIDNLNNTDIESSISFSNNFIINGYIKNYKIIIDSNYYGNILFISDKLVDNNDLYKNIIQIVIDLIK